MIRSSQLENRQPRLFTAYEDRVGPRAGPRVATAAHNATAKGNSAIDQMSASDAPAVARHGLAMNPRRNRRIMRPAKLSTSEVGMHSTTKRKPDSAYGGFRPTAGISDSGEKRRHPIPYPKT